MSDEAVLKTAAREREDEESGLRQPDSKDKQEWTEAEFKEWRRIEDLRTRAEMPRGAAPSTEAVAAHLSYKVYVRNQPACFEPGRLFFSQLPQGVDQRIHDMLQPIFSHINRDDHAERAAFLHITRALLKRSGWQGSDDCSGWLRMYVSHFPCISCVAVSCQFVRFFPGVRLEMDFDNMWKTRFEPADKLGTDRFLSEGGLAGRRARIEKGFFEW
eukprot:TRINITY_DN4324_c1_g1_i1.p1 TRINITY_DN4324_c1_g1~~TRINITY_DN4324_c1_g1_i1.p1  ORF type:complete len:215 (-),score=40.19 TRINITY_DN4324_c1_g1_i1:113-757(-)